MLIGPIFRPPLEMEVKKIRDKEYFFQKGETLNQSKIQIGRKKNFFWRHSHEKQIKTCKKVLQNERTGSSECEIQISHPFSDKYTDFQLSNIFSSISRTIRTELTKKYLSPEARYISKCILERLVNCRTLV